MADTDVTPAVDPQRVLPLSRDDRLALVKAFRARKFSTLSNVARNNVANLLEQIELNTRADGCRIAQEVLAAKLATDVRTLRRWLRIGFELQVVDVDRTGGREHGYFVRWDCVARLGQTHSVTGPETAVRDDAGDAWRRDCEVAPVPSRDGAGCGQTLSVDASTTDPEVVRPDSESRPPAIFARSDRTNVRSDRTFVRSPPLIPLVLNKDPFPSRSSLSGGAGDGKLSDQVGQDFEGPGRQKFPISLAVLADPEQLDQWFEFALSRKWVREIDRHKVFTVAASVYRRSRRRINPVGVGAFVRIVKRRLWKVASEQDDEWARRAISGLDRRAFQLVPPLAEEGGPDGV